MERRCGHEHQEYGHSPGTSYHTNPRAIVTKAEGYINEVVEFRGGVHHGLEIGEGQIKGRAMDLVIPPGASCEQQAALQQVIDYGRSVGVDVRIWEF